MDSSQSGTKAYCSVMLLRDEIMHNRTMICSGIKHLDPILFVARCQSLAKSMVSSFQCPGSHSCYKVLQSFQDLAAHNNYTLFYDNGDLQYIPSLLVSVLLHPPTAKLFQCCLCCFSEIIKISDSKHYNKEDVIQMLINISINPILNIEPRMPNVLNADPSNYNSVIIQNSALKALDTLIQKSEEIAAQIIRQGIFNVIFNESLSANANALRCAEHILKYRELIELDAEPFLLLFNPHVDAEDPKLRCAAMDGLSQVVCFDPNTAQILSSSDTINYVYDFIHHENDEVAISAVVLYTAFLIYGNESTIAAVCCRLHWANFENLWINGSMDERSILCEFVSAVFQSDNGQIEPAYNSGVISTIINGLSRANFSFEVQAMEPLQVAAIIKPHIVVPDLVEAGFISKAAMLMETEISENNSKAAEIGLGFVTAMLSIPKDSEIASVIRRQFDEFGISMAIENLSTSGPLTEEANIILQNLDSFYDID